MAYKEASVNTAIARIEARIARIEVLLVGLAATGAPVPTAAPVSHVAAAPVAAVKVAPAPATDRPYFAATGADLRALAATGDAAAEAEITFRLAKRAAK
jgi:hypothetical protein